VSCSEGSIQELHGWKGNYRELEMSHAYVQWLFPNYFASMFNADSQALTPEEAAVFRSDKNIAQRYLTSYEVFLDFLGLQLYDWASGSVGRIPGGEKRLHAALVMHPHNQLRVRRLLASLAVTGFRRYMAPLVHHLEWEITGGNRLVQLPTDVIIAEESRRGMPALSALRGMASCLETWVAYVDGNEEHFIENTKAVPGDDAPSVLFAGAVVSAQYATKS